MLPLEKIVAGVEKVGAVAARASATTKKLEAAIKVAENAKKQIETIKNVGDGVKGKLNDIKNLTSEQLSEKMSGVGDTVKKKLDDIKNLTPEQLDEKMSIEGDIGENDNLSEVDELDGEDDVKERITDEEKSKIKEETGWSNEIIDAIGSMEEYKIYIDAELQEAEVGGKKCLIRGDIDWKQKDAMERTNKERAEQGLSPINKDGKVIELHHIGQHADSPLAELTTEEHRGKGNDIILHDKTKESEIDRQTFAGERSIHWEARANEGGNLS